LLVALPQVHSFPFILFLFIHLSSLVQMASLPSFVELMASLGLDSKATPPQREQLPASPTAPESPRMELKKNPLRSSSNPSLRDTGARFFNSRYSPYSPAFVRFHAVYKWDEALINMADYSQEARKPILHFVFFGL